MSISSFSFSGSWTSTVAAGKKSSSWDQVAWAVQKKTWKLKPIGPKIRMFSCTLKYTTDYRQLRVLVGLQVRDSLTSRSKLKDWLKAVTSSCQSRY